MVVHHTITNNRVTQDRQASFGTTMWPLIFTLVLLFFCSILGSPPAAANASNTSPSNTNPYSVLTSGLAADTQVEWIDTAAAERIPLLIRPNQSPRRLGSVVIIPSTGHHGNWAGWVREVRHYLSKTGWTTIAMSLPFSRASNGIAHGFSNDSDSNTSSANPTNSDRTPNQQSASGNSTQLVETQSSEGILLSADTMNTTSNTNDSNSSNNASTDDANQANLDRIGRGLAYVFNELPSPVYIIAEGDSALLALQSLNQSKAGSIRAAVLINALPSQSLNDGIKKQKQLIIVELVSGQHPTADLSQVRATLMIQEKHTLHRLHLIPEGNPNFENQEKLISKRVRGLLHRLSQ